MRIAAIDIGTNSFLCLIAEKDSEGRLSIVSDEVEIVRLGQDVNRTHMFQPQALERARKTLFRFRETMERLKPDKVLAVATSAARDVSNKSDLEAICRELNIPLEIISGAREAQMTYLGAISDVQSPGSLAVIDIGGGSTEIIVGDKSQISFSQSVDIGAVRITEMFFPKQPPSTEAIDSAKEYINEKLEQIFQHIQVGSISQVIAVAGTPTELTSAQIGGYDPKKINNHILSEQVLNNYIRDFSQLDIEGRVKNLRISPGRAEVIFAGTLILKQALEKFKQGGYRVSTRGLRFGLALELFQ